MRLSLEINHWDIQSSVIPFVFHYDKKVTIYYQSILTVVRYILYGYLFRTKESGEVTLFIDFKPILIFCHMENFGCGDGGWTLVMKIDGNKVTFSHLFLYDLNLKEVVVLHVS